MTIFGTRDYYKPFQYPWAFEAYKIQNNNRWTPEEVSMADDIRDWNLKLTDAEKYFLTQIFRSFTQSDLDVADTYITQYLPAFDLPELRMMLLSFAATEAVHIHAYTHLIDSVGLPEIEYRHFLEYEELKKRHEAAVNYDMSMYPTLSLPKIILKRSMFGEGVQLFAAFAMLLNFTRFNKMKGMGQIVTWSIRDESLHVESMAKLYNTILSETGTTYSTEEIHHEAGIIYGMEREFIHLAFKLGAPEGISIEDIKLYVKYIIDLRLRQIGVEPKFNIERNPLPWLEPILNSVEHANFFETRSTEYSVGQLSGEWPTYD